MTLLLVIICGWLLVQFKLDTRALEELDIELSRATAALAKATTLLTEQRDFIEELMRDVRKSA